MAYNGRHNYTEEHFKNIIAVSQSKLDAIRRLGSLPLSGTYGYTVLNYYLDLYPCDISHFGGQEIAREMHKKNATPLNEILAGLHPLYSRGKLKARLIREGLLIERCDECQLTEWRGKPIPLDLEHSNGKGTDHRFENLRLLCRNCHAQTDTFAGKNVDHTGSKAHARRLVKIEKADDRTEQAELYSAKLLKSGIDFKKMGWVKQAAVVLERKPQHVAGWMRKHLPDFYQNECLKLRRPGHGKKT